MLNKEELKKLFENGDIPRQEDFWQWQESYFHKDDSIPIEHIAYDFTKKADLVDGKVPASQLPSYVDDVLEFGSYAELPQTGEKGKIYITTGDNKQYRWSGSTYVEIDNTQLGDYIPYEGADRTVNLNSQNLQNVKHFYSHSGIQDGTMGLSVINDAAGGFKSNLLIKVSALAGNMLTFTVKLYSYPYEFYEFQINLYRYQENHHEPTVNWKSGESTHIGKIEFYKDPASGDFYVLILGSQLGIFAYPRVAITDLQAYLGDQTFNKDHWKLEWDADASSLILHSATLSEHFKKDSRAVSTHTDQTISGSKTFKRDLNITDDGLGINFEAGNKIYKKAGSGLTFKKGSSDQNPRVENNDGTKSWEIIHEGNLQNIVSGNNGWGGNFNTITDPNVTHKSGFFGADPNGNLPENYYTAWINVNSWAEHDNYGFQLASPLFGENMYFRKYRSTGYGQKTHTEWYKLWTSNNFNPDDYWVKKDMGLYRAVTTNKPFGVLDDNSQTQKLLAGGLLLSDAYVDESLIPHLGIYSKGDIYTPGQVISDKFSSSKLNGSQIINAGSADQLYIGNPVVDTVYHESGNNHIFTSKGIVGFTIDSNGNIKAKNAVNAGNDSEIGGRIFGKRTVIDTLGLDESKYYPVTIQCNSSYPSTIKVYRTLDNSMGVPSYSNHGGGFWCYYEFEVYGNGWGTTSFKAICNYQDESWVKNDTKVIGYDQMIYSSNVVIYVKGGSKYWFDVNSTSVPTLHTSLYTVYGQTVEPTETRIWSGGILMNANTNDIRNAVNDLGSTLKDYVTLDTPQTITSPKIYAQTAPVTMLGAEQNHTRTYNTSGSPGVIVSGFEHTFYNNIWRTGLKRGGSADDEGVKYAFNFSKDNGTNYNTLVQIDAKSGSIEMANGGAVDTYGNLFPRPVQNGGSDTGIFWKNPSDSSQKMASIGALTNDGNLTRLYMGWGNDPWTVSTSLAVGPDIFQYKGNNVWHAANLPDYKNYGLGTLTTPELSNANDNLPAGIYRVNNAPNAPFAYGTILKMPRSADESTEIATEVWGAKMWFRGKVGGNYTPWVQVWNSANFNPNDYILTSHPIYDITSTMIRDLSSYKGYSDNRIISPNELSPEKLEFGFASWGNDNNYPWADYLHFGGYGDASGGNQNLLMFKKNGFGLRQYQGGFQSSDAYKSYVDYWNTENLSPVTLNTDQTLTAPKTFKAGVNSTRYEWFGSTGTPAGKVTKESAFFNLGADYGYGISTNQVGGLDIMANQAGTAIRLWAGNDNDNPFNVVNFHKEIAKYSTNISIDENKEIRLKGPDDIAHSVKHFSDDTDGFAVSTGFAVKPYNDSSKNLLLVNNSGTYVNGNRVWDKGNLTPFKTLQRVSDLNLLSESGIYREEGPSSGFDYTTTLNLNSADGRQQLTIARNGDGMKFRGSNYGDGNQGWSDWRTVWTDHNFNPETKANAENNAVAIGFDNGKIEMPYIKHNSGTSYLFSTQPVTYHGSSYNANDIHRSGFYSIGHGMKETGNYSGSQDGARALIHFETEDVYSASQIQTERYTGNMVSRTKTDGGWSNWVRHWGSNDFTAGDIANWNNAISQSSTSEEIILEDGQLTVQPDEFSLKGSSSYDIASRRKLVHVLFREGTDLNIGKIMRRQTFVIFNFEKSSININIEGLKPYQLAPATQVTLYIDDEGEVLMYNESNFKKLG
ncbi:MULTISPECIES: pyocin knob domain-containing protein [Chryseobacterium]|uniref:Uncharacterized protein n=1 Tax=Chryseobacterium camelliae TaxID=1265445 RepID=A0ABU0TMZ4_9FLAO|nr:MULTISPECIES: pyocin knob domain-containing protein [Chryseobacterium]MDQ1098412.1 hypothetical protein [Chryseobacterium camelliae]MDR6085772.1 hypothetical protein [Chryseobacterium sp. SORGH_AS_0909]MDR6130137.1 hypothetical protein [Chryseobacterium sp. SORGH_AS_1175]